MTSIPVKEAKNTFTQLLHTVEAGAPVEIVRHGKSVAVLTSTELFNSLSAGSDFERGLAEWHKKASDCFSSKEIDDIFSQKRKFESLKGSDEISHIADLWGNK